MIKFTASKSLVHDKMIFRGFAIKGYCEFESRSGQFNKVLKLGFFQTLLLDTGSWQVGVKTVTTWV